MTTPTAELTFQADTFALGPAVAVSWQLPDPTGAVDQLALKVLRRERRYPGRSRRGSRPVPATPSDLTDGTLVYDSATFTFDFEEVRQERESDVLVTTSRQYRYRGTPADRELVRVVRREASALGVPTRTLVRIIDRSVEAGTRYYYTAFAGDTATYSRGTQSSALATGLSAAGMFELLPEVDRVRDTSTPPPFTVVAADQQKGQLQRFLETFDAHTDMLRGQVEEYRGLYDIRHVDARLLPQLAQLIGWELKDYLDEDAQRVELAFATEFYRGVGTTRNIVAMVNRLTGWDAQVREFVRNVLVTFDSTRNEPLDAGVKSYVDGSMAANPAPPPPLTYRVAPPGSVDTTDTDAMFRLRNRQIDDTTVYTYDCGTPAADGSYVRGEDNWYSRDTIGIFIVPDIDTERFVPESEWERIRQVMSTFLPITVRAVFILLPGMAVEEPYDATQVGETATDVVSVAEAEEAYQPGLDSATDTIPGWQHLITNDLPSRSVDVTANPVDTSHRTWHIGLS